MRPLRALRYAALRALGGLLRAPAAVAAATGVVALAFLLIGLAYLASHTIGAATTQWRGPHMVVYLEEGAPAERARQIGDALASLAAIEHVVHVSESQALERLQGALGEHRELTHGLDASMLPASIEVTLRAGVDDVAAAFPVVERLRATTGVEEVEFAGEWVRGASSLLTGLRHASWLFFVLMCAAGVYLVAAAMTAWVAPRRREAEVCRLLGASPAFVRAPLVFEGALTGAAGAGLAILGLWLGHRLSADAVSAALAAAFGAVSVASPPLAHLALLVAAGAALGGACSFMAARRHALC